MTTPEEKESLPGKRTRYNSQRSACSYGTVDSERASLHSRGSIYRRTSSTPSTNRPFELARHPSKASKYSSRASIQTRLTTISRQEYHGDLKPGLKSGLTRNLVFTVFIIVFGSSFLFGYNIGCLNQPVELIKKFYTDTYLERSGYGSPGTITFLWSLTTALYLPGGMAGAFTAGLIADRLGRKRAIMFSQIFALLGAAISCACKAAKLPEMLMFGRILVGINAGFATGLAPMMLTEISPDNLRGACGTVHQLFVTIGIFMGSVFGLKELLGTEDLWPYILLFNAVPALVSLLALPFLPDSPRYLLLVKGQRKEAEAALKFYRQKDDVATDMEEMDTEHQSQHATSDEESKSFTLLQLFTTRELLMPLFVACMLQVIQQFSGINAIFFYSKGIFKNAKVKPDHIPYAVVGTNAVNVAMTVISVPLMDIAGRRLLLLVPMAVMIVDLAVITICLKVQYYVHWMSYLSVACVIIYVIGFAVGLGPIPQMIGAELFRQGPRPKAMSMTAVVNWVSTFIIAMSFEPFQRAAKEYTFLLFLGLMILFIIFVWFKVPETKNKTFEEIAHQFAPGGEIEVEEVFDDPFDEAEGVDALDNGDNEDNRLVTVNFKGSDESEDFKEAKEDTPLNDLSEKKEHKVA